MYKPRRLVAGLVLATAAFGFAGCSSTAGSGSSSTPSSAASSAQSTGYTEEEKSGIMKACEQKMDQAGKAAVGAAVCECVARGYVKTIPHDAFIASGQTGTASPDLMKKAEDLGLACAENPQSH